MTSIKSKSTIVLVSVVVLLAITTTFLAVKTLGGCQKREKSTTEDVVVATADEAIKLLQEGNSRFLASTPLNPRADVERVKATANHQSPFATIIGCADSRSSVELIFDQGLGDLFVIRSAGNMAKGEIIQGSLDYSIQHLGVKLVVVLGHTHCGGVSSAVRHSESHQDDEHAPKGSVHLLISEIQEEVPEFVGNTDRIEEAIVANVKAQVERIKSVEYISEMVAANQLKVVGALYDIQTGKVSFL